MSRAMDLTAETFGDEVTKPGILFVDFWAAWCGPCRTFAPTFEQAAERHPDIRFRKVDTEAEPDLAIALKIRSIPTLMVFRDGVLVFAQAGALPGEALDELAEKTAALDMDVVRRKVADASASPPSHP